MNAYVITQLFKQLDEFEDEKTKKKITWWRFEIYWNLGNAIFVYIRMSRFHISFQWVIINDVSCKFLPTLFKGITDYVRQMHRSVELESTTSCILRPLLIYSSVTPHITQHIYQAFTSSTKKNCNGPRPFTQRQVFRVSQSHTDKFCLLLGFFV